VWNSIIVILTHFHTKVGPSVFYSFPKSQIDAEILERICDVMDQPNKEEFLTQSFDNVRLLNYYFQIDSEWARGKKEMVMISIMINQQISPEIEQIISQLCKKFSESLQSSEEIFTGFHIKELDNFNESDRNVIIQNDSLIKDQVQDLYWEILEDTRKKSEEVKITLLLNDRYIFESLEEMSRELKTISREISLEKHGLKDNANISSAISNLNHIIDDLYEGYMEKMTVLDFENEDSLLATDEGLNDDVQESKKELIRVLEGEVSRKKE
jgi:hypothetical protein